MISVYSSFILVFFFKQKTAYEMRISDWSSDVCSSDLENPQREAGPSARHGGDVDETTNTQRPALLDLPAQWSKLSSDQKLRAKQLGVVSTIALRSEERRVGNECVSTCRSRWSA